VSPIEKSITLHRKVIYDDSRENLVLITAEVAVKNVQVKDDNPSLLPHEVNQLIFRLEQPEKKQCNVESHEIRDLIPPEEYNQLNRQDL
jgi:hypothetical protein